MLEVVQNVGAVVKSKSDTKFRNDAGLLDKLNGLNVWCKVIVLDLSGCELGADGAWAIAEALRVNSTLHTLYLNDNSVGADGAREIAAALRVNSTLQSLNLGVQGLHSLKNRMGADGVRAIAEALRVNSTLQSLDLGVNDVGADGARAITESWGNRGVGLRV